ncbi:MAG: TonB-dependent receptor [Prevotellaceae bacterium]|jgi:iron complex outermembrane receptor protein|nr:TonB-dependent receptor [Prevotellaceae bacterium]
MQKYIITFVFLFISLSAYNQQIKVADKENRQPIAFANIYFPDLQTGTTTDEDGVFSVAGKGNSVLAQVSVTGYKTFLERIDIQRDTIIFLSPDSHDLQEIVVSGFSTRLQGENVLNVEKMSLLNAENQGINITEKLTKIAGLNNLSTGAGIGKPVIRGLSGNRIAVFAQGMRLENQQWGDEHGLGLGENGYETIEIVKGASSLLYGSDAIGGALHFVDERFANENSVEARLSTEYQSNTNGSINSAALKFSKNRFHANFFGGYATLRDYFDGNSVFVPNSRFNTGNFKTALGYTGTNFVSSLKYSYLREKYGLLAHEHHEEEHEAEAEEEDHEYHNGRTPELPFQDLSTHILSSENTIFLKNNAKIKVDFGWVFNNRKEFEDEHHHEEGEHEEEHEAEHEHNEAALNMNLHTVSYNARWYSPRWEKWSLIAGSQGMWQANKNIGEEVLIPDAQTVDAGIFAVSDFYYSEKSFLQFGVRYDLRKIDSPVQYDENQQVIFGKFDKSFQSVNFSAGVFQPIYKNLSMRLNLSSGFRAPTMYELLSDGVHHGTNRYEKGNLALKTENSYQADLALNFRNDHLELSVNPYFNYFRNYIFLQPRDEEIDEAPVFDYAQQDAILYGGETGFHFHPHPIDWLHIDGSYSITYGENLHREFLPLMPAQKLKTTLQGNFKFRKIVQKFSVFVNYQYSFAQNRIAEYETQTPDYHLFNSGVEFDFKFGKQKLFLNISANNIFNAKYSDHLSRYKSEGILNIGRNIVAKITAPLQIAF